MMEKNENMDWILFQIEQSSRNFNRFKKQVVDAVKQGQGKRAMLYIKCDKFNALSDNAGIMTTKRLLNQYGVFMSEYCADKDYLFRFFSDALLYCIAYKDMEELEKRMDTGQQAMRKWNQEVYPDMRLTTKTGIYLIPEGETNVEEMIEYANIARLAAPEDGYAVFNDSMHAQVVREKEMEDLMANALENKEFQIYLQPKMDIRTKKLAGAEALMRWHSSSEKIMPSEFIPLFEKNGFIMKMDYYMAERVFQMIHDWVEAGKTVVPISINIADENMKDPDFTDKVKALIKKYNIPPYTIEFEIRESMFETDADWLITTITNLRKLGVTFAVDNFGKGPLALSVIHNLPIDVLKISSDFFGHMHLSERERSMLTHIIRMAKSLDMKVLCQGIESESQEEALRDAGCDYVQGFLYAHPMSADAFQRMLDAR